MSFLNSYRYAQGGFQFNNCLVFDGVDDYVLFNSSVSCPSSYTVSLWFKTNVAALDRLIDGGTSTYQIRLENSTTIRVQHNSNNQFTFPSFIDNNWRHLMVTWNGTTTRAYMNGVESVTGGLTGNLINPNWTALGRVAGGGFLLNGNMDEVAIWSGIVGTLTDAQNLYNSGNGADASSVISSPTIHYHLDESGTATTAVDSSGSGNNGTLTNFPASGMWVPH